MIIFKAGEEFTFGQDKVTVLSDVQSGMRIQARSFQINGRTPEAGTPVPQGLFRRLKEIHDDRAEP